MVTLANQNTCFYIAIVIPIYNTPGFPLILNNFYVVNIY